MNICRRCRSMAINPHLHGRNNDDQELCDVCYWRNKAEQLEKQIEKMKCCENCAHMDARNQMMYGEPDECQIDVGYCFDYGYPNWELKE